MEWYKWVVLLCVAISAFCGIKYLYKEEEDNLRRCRELGKVVFFLHLKIVLLGTFWQISLFFWVMIDVLQRTYHFRMDELKYLVVSIPQEDD